MVWYLDVEVRDRETDLSFLKTNTTFTEIYLLQLFAAIEVAFHDFNVEVCNRSVTSHPNPVQCSSCRVEFAAPLQQQLFCRVLLFIEEELMLSMNNLALPGNMAGGGGGNRYISKNAEAKG